jgi:RimJ/RimL family protein N-acetyltransferase
MSSGHSIDVDIRPWSEEDLSLLERLMGDRDMMEHLGGPEPPEKIRSRHERYYRGIPPGEGRMFAIVLGQKRVAAGSVGYWVREWREQTVWETGWSVLSEFQGRGITTRATAAAIEHARAERSHRFMHAFPSVDSAASNAICRKLGFTCHGDVEVEYPAGSFMRCNDWRLDLFADEKTH